MDPIASTTSAGGSVPAPTKTAKADPAATLIAFIGMPRQTGGTQAKAR